MSASPLQRWAGYATWSGRAARTWGRRVRQRARLDTRRRVLAASVVLAALVGVPAAAAMAGTGAEGEASSQLASLLDAFAVTDSHGLSVTDYELSMDDGGWTGKGTGQGISHWMVTTSWDVYRVYVAVAVWLLEVATSFAWLEMVRPPLEVVATALQEVIDRLGVIPVFLTLSVLVAGGWLLKGRYGTAAGEVALSLVLATLAGGVLANPVAVMTGPNGAIALARQLGTELSATVVAGPGAGDPVWEVPDQPPGPPTDQTSAAAAAAQAQSVVAGRIVELFVRTPHQMINYGASLDQVDPGCAQVYDDALAAGPYEDDATVRDLMGECDQGYAQAAGDPRSGLVTAVFVGPSAALLVVLMSVLTVCLLLASLLALWEAARLVVELVKGILPGDLRSGIWECVCSAVTALGLIVGILLGIGVYLQVMSAVFTSEQGWSVWAMFVLVDLLMVIAAVLMVVATMKVRRRGRLLGQKLAARTSPRPVSMPQRSSVPQLVSSAVHLAAAGATMRRRLTPAPQAGGRVPATGLAGGTRPGGTGGEAVGPVSKGHPVRAARAATGVVLGAGKVALASTVGLPVYGPRAATAAWQATGSAKTALKARLATAQTQARSAAGARAHTARAAVGVRAETARAFGQEYVHNVAVAAKFAGKVSGASHVAALAADASIAPGVSAVLAAGAVSVPNRAAGRPPAVHSASWRPAPGGAGAASAPTGPGAGLSPRPVSPADLPVPATAYQEQGSVTERRQQLRRRLAQARARGRR